MSTMFLVQFAIVLLCILVGARVGGIGLGVFGGLGLAILSFGFGLKPAGLPIDVMFMIMAVVSAAAAMQAAGGLDYMIKIATNILRRNPKHITFIAPLVTWTFTVLAGTGHVAYSVLPVIAEVSRHSHSPRASSFNGGNCFSICHCCKPNCSSRCGGCCIP